MVGVDSLLTNLARCCRPAPPDAIGGYVTRGKGVAIHRADCTNFRQMAQRSPERVIAVDWGVAEGGKSQALYAVDLIIESSDRQGLLRDVLEVFAKEKMNVTAVNTQSVKKAARGDSARLAQVLRSVAQVNGVRSARRK